MKLVRIVGLLVLLAACARGAETTTTTAPSTTTPTSTTAATTSTTTPATTTVAATGWRVVDVAADDVLNVRVGPGVAYGIVHTLAPDATGIEITGNVAGIGSSIWVELLIPGGTGWANARFLEPVDPAARTAVEDELARAASFATGGPWEVTGVPSNDVLNVRLGPGVSYSIVDAFAPDASGILSTRDVARIDGSTWLRVVTDMGGTGWSSGSFLRSGGAGIRASSEPCDPAAAGYSLSGVLGQRVAGGTARTVTGLDWAAHEVGGVECERFVVSLGSGSMGRATVRHESDFIHIDLPDVTRVRPEATDLGIPGGLGLGAWVVRSASGDGHLFVNFHLDGDAFARVTFRQRPAQVVVDIIPGIGPPSSILRPVVGDFVVLGRTLSLPAGTQSYPFEVFGYARTFEASVLVRATAGGAPVVLGYTDVAGSGSASEFATPAADWMDTWGEFRFKITSGPTGSLTELFVGEQDPQTGSDLGVTTQFVAS